MRMPANLKKRFLTSSVLLLCFAGILLIDSQFHSFFPCLMGCIAVAIVLASIEMQSLMPLGRPRLFPLLMLSLATVLVFASPAVQFQGPWNADPGLHFLIWVVPGMMIGVSLAALIADEIVYYQPATHGALRIANSILIILVLTLPACFLVKLRLLPGQQGLLALTATILVPKLGDVGAYLVGSLIGKHAMAPALSPKKTWEGFVGGLAVSMATAAAINFLGREPLFKNGVPEALAFGAIVGLAGVFGDLFESMLKRDAMAKDASQSVPGFGGVLDVVDSVLFAAPAAYLFFVFA